MRLLLLLAAVANPAFGQDTPKSESQAAIPYLGPGADKMSADDYQRVYRNYIRTAGLLGYPFFKEKAPPCDQALTAIFRGAGLFGYPVPSDAQNVQRSTKDVSSLKVETYQAAGIILQVARNKAGGLDRLVLVNSSSTKATRRLSSIAKNELLALDKDAATGLERVHGIPVGYPHPYLTSDGQGLFVKVLHFNGKTEGCEPVDFTDNAWASGFDLSDARCTELQTDAEKVWNSSMSPDEFSVRELERMKKRALQSAVSQGAREADAKALVEKHFQMPVTSQINIVGQAMRSLAQCNLLALGRAGKVGKPNAAPQAPETTTPAGAGNGSGTAQ